MIELVLRECPSCHFALRRSLQPMGADLPHICDVRCRECGAEVRISVRWSPLPGGDERMSNVRPSTTD